MKRTFKQNGEEGEVMKICQFCGAENPDSVAVCSSCGANAFKHKCENCGTVFAEGNFCPHCGVKVGSKAKICPRCGAEYYSAACPDCGYIPHSGRVMTVETYAVSQPVKKRRTWLWVLGWIFIFPVPVTILVRRNTKWNQAMKTALIAASWILYFYLVYSQE
ncbi:zinc ribbon domain-containing protein [uncultured Murdochiella sp.]|uniref:double zinc ribbon domain-containing protein n=1 Tax=uncultured Murdochiella sp. TaxID=1586095 RepID=UPI00280622B9|nr:zinc ribbon domain-containing protein [uncultured Murdochiella sp.]